MPAPKDKNYLDKVFANMLEGYTSVPSDKTYIKQHNYPINSKYKNTEVSVHSKAQPIINMPIEYRRGDDIDYINKVKRSMEEMQEGLETKRIDMVNKIIEEKELKEYADKKQEEIKKAGYGLVFDKEGNVDISKSKLPPSQGGNIDIAGLYQDPIFMSIGAATVPVRSGLGALVDYTINPGMKSISKINRGNIKLNKLVDESVNKTDYIVSNPKFKQDMFQDIGSNITKEEKELLYPYIDKRLKIKLSEENLEKAKKWDEKHESNIYDYLMGMKKHLDNPNRTSKYPFDIDVYNKYPKLIDNNISADGYAYYSSNNPNSKYIFGIEKSMLDDPKHIEKVVAHELGHLGEFDHIWSEPSKKRFTDIVKNPKENLNIKESTNIDDDIKYFTSPTEISQQMITNLRQELVNKFIIRNENSIVKEPSINYLFDFALKRRGSTTPYINHKIFKYIDMSKIKEIADLMNEYPKLLTPTIAGGSIYKSQRNKQ